MPSGRIHDRITLWSLPWVGGLTFLMTRSGELTLVVVGAFLFSGMMFGPDLDIYSIQYKRWGPLRWIWLPYRTLLRHRSGFTHGPIIGTILRVFYLLSLLVLVVVSGAAIAHLIWKFDWNWQQFAQTKMNSVSGDFLETAIALFLGLELGAMSHSLSDWCGSAYKRWQKKGRKKQRRRQ